MNISELIAKYENDKKAKFEQISDLYTKKKDTEIKIANLKSIPVSDRERDYKTELKSEQTYLLNLEYLYYTYSTENLILTQVIKDLQNLN
jgi:hypothetical protein